MGKLHPQSEGHKLSRPQTNEGPELESPTGRQSKLKDSEWQQAKGRNRWTRTIQYVGPFVQI